MSKTAEELKQELTALEGSNSGSVSVPAATENVRPRTLEELFAGSPEGTREEPKPLHPFDDKWNETHHVCSECWHRQPIEQDSVCELCGYEAAPDAWVKANIETIPHKAHLADWDPILDKRWKVWASTVATVEELQHIISKHSGPSWKIGHAARILRLQGKKIPKTFFGQDAEMVS
jgi:hypothetical protein